MWTAGSAIDVSQRSCDEVRLVQRHALGVRPVCGQPGRRRIDRQRVVPVERDHLGVDEVVPVVAHTGDPKAQRQLGRRLHHDDAHVAAGPAANQAVVSAPHSTTSSSSGRRCASMPAASNTSGATTVGQRPAQHLSPLTERRAHQLEQRLRRNVDCRRRSTANVGQRRLDLRSRQEHAGRHGAGDPRRRPVRHLHADGAVRIGAGGSTQSFGHLALHHHQHSFDGRHEVEQVAHQGSRHVVRQVGDEHPSSARRPARWSNPAAMRRPRRPSRSGDRRQRRAARRPRRGRPRSR